MIEKDSPYHPPTADSDRTHNLTSSLGPAPPYFALQRSSGARLAVKVFASWLTLASFLKGGVDTLVIVFALRNFGAENRTMGIVAVAALRKSAPEILASALLATWVVVAHTRLRGTRAEERLRVPWLAFSMLPLLAPFVAILCVFAGCAVTIALDVPLSASMNSISTFVVPIDAVFGFVVAGVLTILVGAAAHVFGNMAGRWNTRLPIKLITVHVALWLFLTFFFAVLSAFQPDEDLNIFNLPVSG